MNQNNKRIAKNTIYLYIRTSVTILISLYTSRVVLDTLGEVDYGIYNLVAGIIILFSFMSNSMATATQRFLNYELGKGNIDETHRVFCVSVIVHLLISILIFILGETIGLWFVTTQLNIPEDRTDASFWVYQFSVLCMLCKIVRIPYNACVMAYERMSFYAYASIIEAILSLVIVYLLLQSSIDRLILYSMLLFFVAIVVNTLCYVYCNKQFPICHFQIIKDKKLFSKIVGFSGWSLGESTANIAANQGLSILINIAYGVAVNAALGIANQVRSAFSIFVFSFQTPFSPQIIKNYAANDKLAFYGLIFRASKFSYYLIFIVAPAFMVCLDPIMSLWLVEVPEGSASFVVLLVIYIMVDALSGPLWTSALAIGDIKRYQIIISAIILMNLPVMMLLICLGMSPVAVVSVRAVLNIFAHFARIFYLKSKISFPAHYYMKEVMLRCLIITLLSLPLCFSCKGVVDGHNYVVALAVFVLIMLQNMFFVMLIGVTRSERESIYNVIYDRYRKIMKNV